jgi:hypothetical protein
VACRVLHCLHGLQQQPACLDDRAVGGTEVLAAAVDDGPHTLLDGAVLGVDAVDAGEALRLLDLAVEQVVVLPVALRAERRLIDVERAIAEAALGA